jgi:hypothetical protein
MYTKVEGDNIQAIYSIFDLQRCAPLNDVRECPLSLAEVEDAEDEE